MRAAAAFLTRVPVRLAGPAAGQAAFGVVGAIVGLAGAVPILLFGERTPAVAVVLALGIVALASGGLHLDGLADTADALVAPSPEAAERARRDPSVGPAGVVAIVLVLATDGGALLALGDHRPVAATAVVVAGAGSRAVAVALGAIVRRLAAPGGLAAWFVAGCTPAAVVLSLAPGIALAAAAGLWLAAVVGLVVGLAGGLLVVTARGRLDGDGFGASVELAFAAILVALAVLAG